MVGARWRLLALALSAAHAAAHGLLDDASALVQRSLGSSSPSSNLSSGVEVTRSGPKVITKLGGLLGTYQDGCYVFKGVPYAQKPRAFHAAEPVKPWNRTKLVNGAYGGCIGSRAGAHQLETEDCLKLTIWVPRGRHKDLPVIVFFHGGQNQHGYSQDDTRQGDKIVKHKDMPVIFVGLDYRLGIFGWMQGYGVTPNLGLRDQQLALLWIHEHIANFGGDPTRVTLEGQSEGAHNVIAHLVSPYSRGLFHRAILLSPPANLWSRKTNKVRTQFVIEQAGCTGMKAMRGCLRELSNAKVRDKDWDGVELIRNIGSSKWWRQYESLRAFERGHSLDDDMPSYFGWHPIVDGNIVPHEPRVLIRSGQWNKVPVLITVSKNESMGLIPTDDVEAISKAIAPLFPSGNVDSVTLRYMSSLAADNVQFKDRIGLLHALLTDKMWTCDARSLADDIVTGGGRAHLGMFWHSPNFDPYGAQVNKKCTKGATCHAAEMFYALPQGRGKGIPDSYKKETKFAMKYMTEMLNFVYGKYHVWSPWDNFTQIVTFYDTDGPRYVRHYRAEQCKVLDSSVNDYVPNFIKFRAKQADSQPAVQPSALIFEKQVESFIADRKRPHSRKMHLL